MKKAMNPSEITNLLVDCIMTGNIEGISHVYEDDAILITGADHQSVRGIEAIKAVYAEMIEAKLSFDGSTIHEPIINGDMALTSSTLPDGRTTAEVARRQPDGSWKWCLDNPMFATPVKDL